MVHSNSLTLDSMKDVHKQLCVIKRKKAMAAESAKAVAPPKPASVTAKPSVSPSSLPSPTSASTSPPPAPIAPTAGGSTSSANTTISLTGTGTNYSKVDGPIDASFKSNRQQAGTFQGIKVWGPLDPPGQLGIWGNEVCVDFDI
ncbi:MAG TPA: hypothetical protein VKA87_00480, partial [Nitrososphaeraceae archaeon]|nr:hypothetical protein [Nitrososphaeraceae archaeon]